MSRSRVTVAIAAIALALMLVARPAAAEAPPPTTVVELFTSQGCSSCPPADKFLGELAERPDLLALSIHVDYWDYIGWKDPFASPDNTRRQRDYARTMKLRFVYTPQMVIQGASHATGSDRSSVLRRIKEAQAMPRLPVTVRHADGKIAITVAGAGQAPEKGTEKEEAAVWLAAFDRRHETAIRRGENGGRTLAYHNVVRTMQHIGTWNGAPLTLSAALADLGGHPDGCAVIVQSVATGRILGAAKIALPKS
jgi:hypothetical protein